MSKWSVPIEVSDLELGIGSTNMVSVLPAREEIPEEFKKDRGKWQDIVDTWFYRGIEITKYKMKEGIEFKKAMRHLKSIMSSWEPKHEHKIAGVAYLMSLWFEEFECAESPRNMR